MYQYCSSSLSRCRSETISMEITQLLLSMLHAWTLDNDLDKLCLRKLGLERFVLQFFLLPPPFLLHASPVIWSHTYATFHFHSISLHPHHALISLDWSTPCVTVCCLKTIDWCSHCRLATRRKPVSDTTGRSPTPWPPKICYLWYHWPTLSWACPMPLLSNTATGRSCPLPVAHHHHYYDSVYNGSRFSVIRSWRHLHHPHTMVTMLPEPRTANQSCRRDSLRSSRAGACWPHCTASFCQTSSEVRSTRVHSFTILPTGGKTDV